MKKPLLNKIFRPKSERDFKRHRSTLDAINGFAESFYSFSEADFRAMVERYAGMVMASALRRTGDQELTEDVTQRVFIILARKAKSLQHRRSVLELSWSESLFSSSRSIDDTTSRNLTYKHVGKCGREE